MNRKGFISNLISLGGLSFIPQKWIKTYTKIYLLQCFAAGFRYYEGPGLLESMKEGDMLELVREPDNLYDEAAIALHFNSQKIGFIPSTENNMLARLLDAGAIELMAEITHLEKDAASWENVHIALYVLKEDNGPLPDHANYLTELDTPNYRSLKRNNEKVSHIIYDQEQCWYDVLVNQSKTDNVYGLIHTKLLPLDMLANHDEDFVVINKNKLPDNKNARSIIDKIDAAAAEIDYAFDEEGYIVLQTQKLSDFLEAGREFKSLKDKWGRRFLELKFDFS